ncbi:MAG: ABC transporter substrate-binding protein, partial [Burkholderiales bacterium]|nr:ABC transporter substrate-binding protein [Burkholderiales bacterium]
LWAASVVRGRCWSRSTTGPAKWFPSWLSKVDLYLACHADVPTPLVDRLNAALLGMVRDGTTRAIEKKYARWPLPPH